MTSIQYRCYGRIVRTLLVVKLATVATIFSTIAVANAEFPPQPAVQNAEESGVRVNETVIEANRALRFRKLIEQATEAFKTGKYDEAIERYSSAHQLRQRPLLLFNIAQIYRKVGRTRDARNYYERFLREDPQSELAPEVHAYLIALQDSLQTNESAKDAGRNSTSADNFIGTEDQRQNLFRLHCDRASASFKTGDYETTVSEYWAAYNLKPQKVILFNIAQAYRKAERWTEALTLFQRYLQEEPGSSLAGEVEGYITEARARVHIQQSSAERETAERLAKANAVLAEKLIELREIDRQIVSQRLSVRPKPIYRRGWFWGVIGVTIAGAAIGVGLGVGLSKRTDPASELGLRVLDY